VSKLRIGINLLFMIPGVVGGTETHAVSLVNALSVIDVENEYYIFINKESRDVFNIKNNNFKIISCKINAINRCKRYLFEQTILPILVKNYKIDVLHSMGYVSPLILPCKSIVTIHDANVFKIKNPFGILGSILIKYLIKKSGQKSNLILAVSEASRSDIIKYYRFNQMKVDFVYNSFKRTKMIKLLRNQEFINSNKPYILAFSSKSPHKNMEFLIEAYKLIKYWKKNYKLVIVGHLPKGFKKDEFKGDIIYTGYISDEKVYSIFKKASLLVFPSLYEGFGIPVLEAFHHGVPVACSNIPSLREIAGNSALFFDPYDINEIAKCIINIMENFELRKKLIQSGLERERRFTWNNSASKLIHIYKEVFMNGN